ncbi:MAG: DUF3857 domain-containing protein [Ferruginibacter sp.]
MKWPFFLLTFIFAAHTAIGQKRLPAFGKIDIADLELKDCAFDPGADACKLIDWGNLYFTRSMDETASFTTIYERRVRIKIFNQAGLSYANLKIPFYSYNNDEKIIKMDACTYNITEGHAIKKTTVYNNAVYTRKIDKQYSELTLLFPEVKVGSVIEYKYVLQRKTIADVKDWYFQSSIPTRYSEYQVSIPSIFRFTIQPLTADSLEIKETKGFDRLIVKSTSTPAARKNFIMRNLPAVRDEPYMGAVRDYLQRLSLQLSGIDYGNGNVVNIRSDWDEVVKELMEDNDFGGQVNRIFSETTAMTATAQSLPSMESRIDFVYNFVKKNMQWDGRETIYSYDGIKKAFRNKRGSNADINLLLLSLLNQAGIPAVPILFSTRDNGLVNTTLPFLNQFNTVMVLVEDSNKYFILDATDNSAYNLVPARVVNTKGFVVSTDSWKWLDAVDNLHTYKLITAMQGDIDTAGIMKGDVLITSSGYARKQYYEDWVENRSSAAYLAEDYKGFQVNGVEINNLQNDTLPLEQKLHFAVPVENSGQHYYFKLNLFSGLEENQFMAAVRHTDIDFSYQQEYTIYGSYTIPADYLFEELPQNVSLIMPDTSIVFKRFISADNNSLNVRMSIDFKRSLYTAGEYPEFSAFYKILLSKLNEQVVIKKNNQP